MAIALKVHFPGTGAIKAMRFSVDVPIQQVVSEIREKISATPVPGQTDGADHGLFQPEVPGKQKARWLKENHTLKYYNLAQETEVVYKKKTRPAKVRLIDNTVKTVLIDDTAKVGQIRDSIGKKLGIKSVDEYGLKLADSNKWLNLAQGLHEQDVKEEDLLVFDKTLFFFDDALDMNDAVQLHLIYNKSVQSIIDGTYPCSEAEAFSLAGIEAQVLLGNFDAAKHTPNMYPLDQLLPQQWAKDKKKKPEQIALQISSEHRKLHNTPETQAKYRYVQMVRQLPSYGVTFYTVQAPHPDKKQQKKGKMIELLLGVTREKIMQLDMATKAPLREYPLVHLKRWAAVRGKFTFDFGDHQDDFWTVYTDQGDQISALIGGYIDIIINSRKQGVKQIDVDQREATATVSDMAHVQMPQYAYTMAPGGRGQVGYAGGLMEGQMTARPASMNVAITDVASVLKMAELVREELGQPLSAQERRNTRRLSNVTGEPQWLEQLVTFEKGTDLDVARIVDGALTAPAAPAFKEDLQRAVASIGTRLKTFAPAVQRVGAANGLEEATTSAAQGLVDALTHVITAAQNVAANPHDAAAKAALTAAKQKYDASMLLMKSAQSAQLNDEGTAELVRALGKAVDLTVQGLRFDVAECEKTLDGQNATILRNMGKQLEPALHALESGSTTLATALLNPAARKHIVDAGSYLATLAGQLNATAQRVGASPEWLDRIGRGAGAVGDSVKLLVQALDVAEDRGLVADVDEPLKRGEQALRQLQEAGTNQKAMLDSIKTLAAGANDVIRTALQVAKASPPDVAENLEQEAARLKESIAELTEAGKEAIKNPTDQAARQHLLDVARRVDDGLNALGADLKNVSAAANLRAAAKAALGQAVALQQGVQLGLFMADPSLVKATITIPAVPGQAGQPGAPVRIEEPKVALKMEAVQMGDALKTLLTTLAAAARQPQNEAAQEALLNSTKQLGPQVAKFVASAKRSDPLMGGKAKDVQQDASQTQDKLGKLLSAVQNAQKADVSGADVSTALKNMEANQASIASAQFSAASDLLVAPASREAAQEVLQQMAEGLAGKLEGLSRAALSSGPLALPSNEVASAMGDLVMAAEGVAGALPKERQAALFAHLQALATETSQAIKTARTVRVDKGSDHAKAAADAARAKAQTALGNLVAAAAGQDQTEITETAQAVRHEQTQLRPTRDGQDYKTASAALAQRTKALQAAAQQLVAQARSNPKRVGAAAKLLQPMARNIVAAANAAAGAAPDEAQRKKLLDSVNNVLGEAARAVEAAGAASATGHMEAVEEAVQRLGALIAALETSATGSRVPEVESVLERIAKLTQRLEAARVPQDVEGKSRKDVLKTLDGAIETLAGSLAGLLQASRLGTGKLGLYASETGEGVQRIVEASLQARAPFTPHQAVQVDAQVADYVRQCDEIIGNPASTAAVGSATVQLGNLTKALAAGARDVAATLQGEHQKNYVNSAKALAAGVPKLVAAVKGGKPALVSKCAEFLKNTVQKMEAARLGVDVDDLSGGGDAPVPAPVQTELSSRAKAVAAAASHFVRAAGQLAGDPTNPLLSAALSTAADALSDALGGVSSIARTLDPVKHTCQETAEVLQTAGADLDVALVNAGMGLLEKPKDAVPTKLRAELADLLQSYAPDVATLHEKMGVSGRDVQAAAERVQLKTPQLVQAVMGVAALEANPNSAKKVVAQARDFLASLQQLVGEVEVGGERAPELAQAASERLGDMLGNVKQAGEILAELSDVAKKVRDMDQTAAPPGAASGKPYAEIKEALVQAVRATTAAATALHQADPTNVGNVGVAAKSLARTLPPLMVLVRDAAATLPDAVGKSRLTEGAQDLLDSAADLIQTVADVAQADDLPNRAALKEAWSSFTEAVPALLAASKKGAQGESAIDEGADQLSQSINKLQMLSIFASAGQELEGVKRAPQPYDQLVPRAQAALDRLTQAAPALGKAALGTEEQLGLAVGALSQAYAAVQEAALQAADRAPDSETQQHIIAGSKAVAIAAKQLVLTAKDAQRSKEDSMLQKTLQSALAAFPAATSTLAQVLAGEGAGSSSAAQNSATSASVVERAKAAVLDIASVKASAAASASSVVESARTVSQAASPLVFAASPEQLNQGASDALNAVQELVAQVKGAGKAAPAVAPQLQQATKAITEQMAALIGASSILDRNATQSEAVANASAQLNEGLQGLVGVVTKMPGGSGLVLHSAEDLEKRTDSELSAAVEYVKRVVSALPKVAATAPQLGQTDLSTLSEKHLSEAMTRAVHEIAENTQRLIITSMQAEQESRAKGASKYRADPTWANGLISASNQVASGVGRLVAAIEKASRGELDEEELVANAKHVATSVKHLYMAARTRQGVTDKTASDISEASKAVARSTADVVKAAQQAGDLKHQKESQGRKRGASVTAGAAGIAQKLEQQAAILRLEKQLEDARRGLLKMNKSEATSQKGTK